MILRTNSDAIHKQSLVFYEGAPIFPSPECWLAHYREAIRKGERPYPPRSRDELLLAETLGLLQQYPHWIPGKIGLRLLGLPDSFGRRQEPWGEKAKERLLRSMTEDPQFASAILTLLRRQEA